MIDNRIVLRLGDDGRVLGAAWYRTPPDGAVVVAREALPAGDVMQYRYVEGEFVHDPLPEPEPEPEPPTTDERLDALESTTDDIILMMAELIGG